MTTPAETFSLQIKKVQSLLSPFLEQPLDEIQHEMTPLEKAKLNACLAYAANTLFYMYLKATGVSSQQHPVHLEMKRIQQYILKIKQVQNEKDAPSKSTQETAPVAAANNTKQAPSSKGTPGKRKRSDSSNNSNSKSKKKKMKHKKRRR